MNVSFTIEVIVPDRPYAAAGRGSEGKGHPVFVTQRNHRRWALKGVARGYAACIYPGADVDDQSLASARAAAFLHGLSGGTNSSISYKSVWRRVTC